MKTKFVRCPKCNDFILAERKADHYLRHLTSGMGATRITSVLDQKETQNVR